MTPQDILNRALQIEIGKLVMDIAVLKAQAEVQAELQKSVPEGTAGGSGTQDGARSADGPENKGGL